MSRTPDATRAGGTLPWAIGGSLVPPEVGEVPPSLWLADWDGDGQWEALAGVDRGHIYYWRE